MKKKVLKIKASRQKMLRILFFMVGVIIIRILTYTILRVLIKPNNQTTDSSKKQNESSEKIATSKYNNGEYDSLEYYLKARGLVNNLKADTCE